MPADTSTADIAVLIAAGAAAAVSIINALQGKTIKREAKGIKNELKTMNESTLGQLGEANEARRIAKIPLSDRTPQEKRHMGMTNTDTSDTTQTVPHDE